MPKVPGISLEAPTLPGVQIQRDSAGAMAEARAAAKLGEAVQKVGGLLTEVYVESQVDSRTSKATASLNDFVTRLKKGEIRVGDRPADPLEYQQLYEAERDRVLEETKSGMVIPGVGSDRRIQSRMRQITDQQLLDVKTFALDKFKEGTMVNTLESLEQDQLNFVNASNLGKTAIEMNVQRKLKQLVETNVMKPAEAYKHLQSWRDGAETASFQSVLRQDPLAAYYAAEKGEFNEAGAEKVERFKSQAMRTFKENERAEAAERRRIEADEREAKRQMDIATGKALDKAYNEGKLTYKMVLQNEDNLLYEKFKYYAGLANGKGVKESDPKTWVDLRLAVAQGKDVSQEIITAKLNGLLTTADSENLIDELETNSISFQQGNAARVGQQELAQMLKVSEDSSFAVKTKAAQILGDYAQWVRKNPNKTLKEIREQVKIFADEARIVSLEQFGALGKRKLRFSPANLLSLKGEELAYGLLDTIEKTEDAYLNGKQLDLDLYVRELEKITEVINLLDDESAAALRNRVDQAVKSPGSPKPALEPTPLLEPSPTPGGSK